MLSKLATRNFLGRNRAQKVLPCQLKAYSTLVVQEDVPLSKKDNYRSLWEISAKRMAKDALKVQEEAEYLDHLKQSNVERAAFKPVTINVDDHSTIKQIKNKINAIVEQELALVDFKAQVNQEDLAADTLSEVITKKNFYFQVDENKVQKNIRVANMKAPGNKWHKPNYILPHEHVPYDGHMSVGDLTEDKLLDIYAYYSYLIDMHIAQVRPDNLDEKSYIPSRLNQCAHNEESNKHLDNRFFEFYHRWREPTRTWISQTQELNHEEWKKNRPTTTHYDHDRGSKFEVEWTDEQKWPHVADRLGYPVLREDPIERIFGIERSQAHPGYQFQPFVQTPSMDPDPTLNFKEGDVIYENRNVTEWARFWKTLTLTTVGFAPGFYVFEIYAADGIPSLSWAADNWMTWQIPQQFQDGGGDDMKSYRYCDDHDYMNWQYSGKRMFARPAHTAYCCCVFFMLQIMNLDYVSKMVYNKDKDVVFVYKPEGMWFEHQTVYEMHHLEQMVPLAVTSIKNMSMQKDDGIITVYDMNTKNNLKFYGEDKYWNMDLKDEFMAQTRNLWVGNFSDKRSGHIFNLYNSTANEEDQIMMMKVDRELEEAIAKHGEAVRPSQFEDEFDAKIQERKRDLVAAI